MVLISKLQHVSVQAQEQETELREKNGRIYELEQEKVRLVNENKMYRAQGTKKEIEEGAILSFKESFEEERRRKRREKEKLKMQADLEK